MQQRFLTIHKLGNAKSRIEEEIKENGHVTARQFSYKLYILYAISVFTIYKTLLNLIK